MNAGGQVSLRSRNDKDFSAKYSASPSPRRTPDETVLDGEDVALDESGLPSFNALQNFVPGKTPLLCYVSDVMILAGTDLMGETLPPGAMRFGRCRRN